MKIFHYLSQSHKWIEPKGYDTGIKVYNCIAKTKVPLIVRNKNNVSWYTCGPTVYDSAHIGHASCYVKLDIIQRILREHCKLNLVTVMNITDIDDKIINKSTALNKPYTELTEMYETEFWKDLNSLNIVPPNIVIKVTEHIPKILQFIKSLVEKNAAYVSNGSVYFSVHNYQSYNKLQSSGSKDEHIENDKISNKDFALWKKANAEEVFWQSEWGPGRPGWHIECSTLASLTFGSVIDIHVGGIDLRFPHHENEEAQSCSFHDTTQWVNYWLHTGHLRDANAVKMSKSLKNTVAISELLKICDANTFRMVCLLTTYRQPMIYSSELLNTAASTLNTVLSFFNNYDTYFKGHSPNVKVDEEVLLKTLDDSIIECNSALCNDFDTATVMKVVISLIHVVNKLLHVDKTMSSPPEELTTSAFVVSPAIVACKSFIGCTLEMFGLALKASKSANDEHLYEILDSLIGFRQSVRSWALNEKNSELLQYCDVLRNDLKRINVVIKDHGKISTWHK